MILNFVKYMKNFKVHLFTKSDKLNIVEEKNLKSTHEIFFIEQKIFHDLFHGVVIFKNSLSFVKKINHDF